MSRAMSRTAWRSTIPLGALFSTLLIGSAEPPLEAQTPASPVIARWLFDEGKGDVAGDGGDGKLNGKILKASWNDGRSSKALAFEDYSLRNYLKPDVREATRVVIPNSERLNIQGSFTLRAVVFPTRDPIYYGGIFEKGRGYGCSYRLLLKRGLRVAAVAAGGRASIVSPDPLSLNAWHELVMKYDGDTLSLVIDGKEAGKKSGVKTAAASQDDAVVGERFSGRIDEITLTAP